MGIFRAVLQWKAALKETSKILMVAKAGMLRRRGSAVASEGHILG
jgi:hypothetical protein